jgi:hypothetical protein
LKLTCHSNLDDRDTKELLKLTEEIQRISRKMKLRDQQRQQQQQQQPKTKTVYLPLHHTRKKRSSEEDLRLVKQPGQAYQTRNNHQKMHRVRESSLDRAGVKFYIVNNKPSSSSFHTKHNDYSLSPERRYMSSIEIPAEHIEHMKTQTMTRSKSASSTSTMMTMENSLKKSNLKQPTAKPISKSMIAVNVGAKARESGQQQQHKHRHLNAKRVVHVNEDDESDDNYDNIEETTFEPSGMHKDIGYLLKLLKSRDRKISLLKEKIVTSKMMKPSENTSSISSYLDALRNTIKSRHKSTMSANTDADADSVTSDDEQQFAKIERTSRKTTDYGMQVNQEDLDRTLYSESMSRMGSHHLIGTALMCNIPEHHLLEDLNHANRDEISRLKFLLQTKTDEPESTSNDDDHDELVDKRAEFEALDLAISDRKKKLFDLEIKKRLTLTETVRNVEDKTEMKERLILLTVCV